MYAISDMIIRDNYDNEVIHLNRPLRCNSCLFPCCLQEIEISSPPGQVIGTVVQDWSLCTPQFSVKVCKPWDWYCRLGLAFLGNDRSWPQSYYLLSKLWLFHFFSQNPLYIGIVRRILDFLTFIKTIIFWGLILGPQWWHRVEDWGSPVHVQLLRRCRVSSPVGRWQHRGWENLKAMVRHPQGGELFV